MRAFVLALTVFVAGCAGGAGANDPVTPGLDVTDSTGGIRGLVGDEAIRPIAGALVEFLCTGEKNTTDEHGSFTIVGLPPGSCLLRASHPLYDSVQQAVAVEAGAADPPLVKVQLTRVIFAEPYTVLQKFDGFLVCSIGFSVYASEECGEGVGVPCEVPVMSCQRVGGQDANLAQWDFYLDGPWVRTLIVEMQWESTSPTVTEFEMNLGTDWTCDPFCNGRQLNISEGPSPLYATVDFPQQLYDRNGNEMEHTADVRFSTFVWPAWGSGDPQQLNVAVNQPFTQFATAFYYIPAPAGFSLLAGDIPPY